MMMAIPSHFLRRWDDFELFSSLLAKLGEQRAHLSERADEFGLDDGPSHTRFTNQFPLRTDDLSQSDRRTFTFEGQ